MLMSMEMFVYMFIVVVPPPRWATKNNQVHMCENFTLPVPLMASYNWGNTANSK